MTSVDALFAVQDEDVLSGQLHHRYEQLPERARLVDARAAQTATAAENGELDLERLDMLQRQHRIEGEVTAIETRLAELDGKLYGGAITTAREASTLQEEIEHLRRRQDVLESDLLEFMEAIEPLDEQLAELAELGTRQEASIAGPLREKSDGLWVQHRRPFHWYRLQGLSPRHARGGGRSSTGAPVGNLGGLS